jgi:hypothetical protein
MNKKINNRAPSGPEDMPLREYIKNFPLTVSIFDGDKLIREEYIDYGNFEHRKWLGKVTFWACNEGYTVETMKTE